MPKQISRAELKRGGGGGGGGNSVETRQQEAHYANIA